MLQAYENIPTIYWKKLGGGSMETRRHLEVNRNTWPPDWHIYNIYFEIA